MIFSKLRLEDKLIHRRTIWSFTREKIEDKPIFGYGIFSSRSIGENHEVINLYNIKMSAIPLHTHNGILQIWLELGLVGVVLFYLFICMLVKKIYNFSKENFYYAAASYISLIQTLLIGQLSYGFWQAWWISIIIINFILYSIIFNKIKFSKKLQ